jgi:ubiquinone/menaquinone biosynthesis C-methylase UbiE
MNWINQIAKNVFHRLSLPRYKKYGLKKGVYTLIPAWEQLDSLDRKSKLLSRITPASQDGLEFGPLSNPVVSKAESAGRISYVDHASAETLREKYRDDPSVRLNEIVGTDYVWGECSMPEIVGDKKFDYAIGSHVIEHVPDMLGWLKEIGEVLKDRGILSLAIPDKRYTFDYLRELSNPGAMIEAYLSHRRRPSAGEAFDHFALLATVDAAAAWEGRLDKTKLERMFSPQLAFEIAQDTFNSQHYNDVHVSVVTPASFLDLLEMASVLNLIDFVLVEFYDTARNTIEFFVSLERIPRDEDRKISLRRQLDGLNWARRRLA